MLVAQKETAEKVETKTKQEALENCNKILNDDLAARVLVDKYLLCDTFGHYYEWSPQQMWDRLARAIVKPEKEENQEEYIPIFRELLDDFKFVPAGRILYGLGNSFVNATLKNCYVIGIEEDSIEGIFKTAWRMAETYKGGGGCGIDISPLRPKGSPIHNAARISSGAVGFMDFFSHITGMIGQKARIGALMICIDVSHPDVEDFIDIKGGDDLNKVRFANVSVKITDEFMHAVEDDTDFNLVWGGEVYKTIRARELWNKIIHKAWKRAEPGILFWDTMTNYTPAHNYPDFKCVATNPCISGDSRILTENGYRTARELWKKGEFQEYDGEPTIEKHGSQNIIGKRGITTATNVYKTADSAALYRVRFNDGSYVDATANHNFIIADAHPCAHVTKTLKNLKIGDRIPRQRHTSFGSFDYEDYAMSAGWVIGDGSICYNKDQMRAILRTWNSDIEEVMPTLEKMLSNIYDRSNTSTNQQPKYESDEKYDPKFDYNKKTVRSAVLGRLLREDGLYPGNKHIIPQSVWSGTKDTIRAFLCGLFSADGGVQINHKKGCASVRLAQSNEPLLQDCQLLLSQLGIDSAVRFRRKASKQLMNDGKGGKKLYNRRAQYELIVSKRENLLKFSQYVGFIQQSKQTLLGSWLDSHKGSNNSNQDEYKIVESIEYLGEDETFCLTEPERHVMTVSGVQIGQCGEVPLSHGDSCNLGSINLSKYVENEFSDPSFNYDNFSKDIKTAIRFLDNIISLENAPMEFQQKANDNGRRLGLGIMGLADMFIKMKVKFDSTKAIDLVDSVMQSFRDASYEASMDLAEEKGSFPDFSVDTHNKSKFIQQLPGKFIDRIQAHGIRNISLNAIAPTGSISCIAGCSSGIEPVFMMKHIRKTNLGTAKEVQEHVIFHKTAKEWLDRFANEEENEKSLPDYFVEAHQVNPDYRIKLQGTIQKYIDQSISNTVNLPNKCKEDDVAYYYNRAWMEGCKGITIYRDGSREGVLVSAEKKVADNLTEICRNKAPKRPEELDAEIQVIKPNGKIYTVFIGLLKGRPYEVFAVDNELAGVPDGMSGKIIKKMEGKDKTYNFVKGCLEVKMLNRYEDSDASLITRLLSTSLRHGVPLEFVINQMSKSKAGVTSLAKAIGRALSKYINSDEIKGVFKCPDCGSRNMKFEGTCHSCLDCGFSRCG